MANPLPLRSIESLGSLSGSKAARVLQSIRRDMDLTDVLMRKRRRNEQVLSLVYQETTELGGGHDWENVRENFLNLPWRQVRWYESQATSKKMIVKVDRNAGPGQKPGGPGDEQTGMWVGETLKRVAYEGGFQREMKALINEVMPRGTSVMAIGYHEDVIDLRQAQEVGKDPQSLFPEIIGEGDTQAKPGQAHADISKGLAAAASDPRFQAAAGQEGVELTLQRKDSHDEADFAESVGESPINTLRMIRRKVWMRKKRVGEDVGWAPFVYDVEDTPWWWDRHVWTLAQVLASDLFTDEFKRDAEGWDARDASGVARSGKMPSTESMGSDARQAQSEDMLDPDEMLVEFFVIWYRRPEMKSGGIRKIVSAETPEVFIHASEDNPHVDEEGFGLIKGFYPFYDFTPHLSSLTVPERTKGIPPVAAGMTQAEKLAEYNRIRQEAALKGATRINQIHPGLKDSKKALDALNNGEIGFSFVADKGLIDKDGKMIPAIINYSFTGVDPEIDRQAAMEEANWVKMTAMPPAILQSMGTAETATQDQQGIAAGEREAGAVITYFQQRVADVLTGMRGLVRGNLDDEDFQKLLGEEGAAVMKAWQTGTVDDGDEIEVTFGMTAQAQEVVERKQLIDAITLMQSEVEPLTGLQIWRRDLLVEELFRRLNVGKPQRDETPLRELQMQVLMLRQVIKEELGVDLNDPNQSMEDLDDEEEGKKSKKKGSGKKKAKKKPAKSEGSGPQQGTVNAGARRDTVSANESAS